MNLKIGSIRLKSLVLSFAVMKMSVTVSPSTEVEKC